MFIEYVWAWELAHRFISELSFECTTHDVREPLRLPKMIALVNSILLKVTLGVTTIFLKGVNHRTKMLLSTYNKDVSIYTHYTMRYRTYYLYVAAIMLGFRSWK